MSGPVKRAFVDLPDGQIHVRRNACTAGTPLLCFHQSPASSLVYAEILPLLRRPAIAVDTPGFGESFRPSRQPGIVDYARWIAQVPTALGYDRVDIMGLFTGAGIAAELAVAQPMLVRRVVLAGPPLFDAAQRARFVSEAWPIRPKPDGSHLQHEWQRRMTWEMPVPFERRLDAFNEYYRGGANAIWGEQAIAVYPIEETLPRITQRTLILKPQRINGDADGAAALVPDARLQVIDMIGLAMMQAVPGEIAAAVNAFLDEA